MDIVTQVILPLSLAFIMFSMGLSLTIEDFKRVAKFPKAFMVGSLLQVVSLPLLAFLIAKIWMSSGTIQPEFAVGLIIIAACPGGVTSNLMTHLGKGDTALSISLTAVIGVLSVFTIPFIVNFGFNSFMGEGLESPLPVGKTIVGIFCISTVPVLIGMIIKSKFPNFTAKFEPISRNLASLLFVLIVLAAFAKKWGPLSTSFQSVGPIIVFLNIATMIFAILMSKLAKLNKAQSVAITFECGLQNGTLAIMISLTFLGNELMMIPAGIYSLAMFITGGIYLGILKKMSPKQALA